MPSSPVPEVRATEPAAAASLPPVCGETLPLPSEYEFKKSEYELLLGRFMAAECYKHLGWERLFSLTGHLDLSNTRAEGWKLLVVSSGAVAVPGGSRMEFAVVLDLFGKEL